MRSPSSILVDEWGYGLVSLDLDGKEQRCAQADASGLTCEIGWGVPSLGSYQAVGEDYPDHPDTLVPEHEC